MTTLLPPNAGHALRYASPKQQEKILAILGEWPSNIGQSTSSYSKALHRIIGRVVQAWGGVWLNADKGTRTLKLQCAKGHIWSSKPFLLHRGHWCSGCYVDSLHDSIETMQQLAVKRHGKCLSKTYVNTETKLQWQCQEGHRWEMTPYLAKKGKWCAQCELKGRQTNVLTKIQERALERGGKCLSEQYIDVKTKMTFRCAYGHIWQTTPKSIKSSNSWCPVCRYDKKKNSFTDLHILAAAKGGLCLAKKYTSMNEKVEWQCAKGHVWRAEPCKVQLGTWCPTCAHDRLRLTLEEMQVLAKSRGGKCLSTHYKTVNDKLLWECKMGHTWLATPGHIKNGTWCPQCAILAQCKYEKAKRKYLPDKRKSLDAEEGQNV